MEDNVHALRPKLPDSEKVTVNLGFVDLGHIDLMVRDGFFANRADFIRTAVRNQLERQGEAVRQSVARKGLELGLSHYSRAALEAARDAEHRFRWRGTHGVPAAALTAASSAS